MTIPTGANLILAFVGHIEAPRGYETIFANKQSQLPKPLTSMTLDEVIKAGPGWSKRNGSSAAGKFQFMSATLKGLKTEMGLSGSELFNGALQDRMAYHLLKRRGYLKFAAGEISRTEFGKRLSQEWASLPVLEATQGGSRKVTRGQSYYAGDGLNKSLTAPDEVENLLDRVYTLPAAQTTFDGGGNEGIIGSPIPTITLPTPKPNWFQALIAAIFKR